MVFGAVNCYEFVYIAISTFATENKPSEGTVATLNGVAIIIILFLNIIDALLTLFLIDLGATEINPVMAYFLNFGPLTFMSVKYFLTCFSIIVLLIFNNVFLRKIKIYTRSLFSYIIGGFMIVIGWELFLTVCILF